MSNAYCVSESDGSVNLIDDADDGMIDRHKFDRHRQRGLARRDDEYQHARPRLGRAVGGDHRLAFRLLPFVQRLDDEKLYAFQPRIFLSGNQCAGDFSELHSQDHLTLDYSSAASGQ